MHLNILHRTDPGPLYEIFRLQQKMVHEAGLSTTVFLHYADLFDESVLADVRADHADYGDELALALHRLNGPWLDTGECNQFWLLPADMKRSVLGQILERWHQVFGEDPLSISCYHLDAESLRLIRELSPGCETVVAGCFEEGVRVFHGCNHSWYLFNEGMPWGPWFPSRHHALRPAANKEDAVGLVAVPHLVRDMSLSYEGRNDFWASHPPNVIRGMGNEATWSPYDLNLIDQYRLQEKYNPWPAYVNTFVSAPWLTWNHNSEYPPEVARTLYQKQLDYFVELRKEGRLQDLTLSEYGRWFRENRNPGDMELYWAREILYGSGKHYLWYLDDSMRVLIDCEQGGSIGDLRAYLGKVSLSTGPESPLKAIGSYPYLIQSQYRTGSRHHCHDGSRTTAIVEFRGMRRDLCEYQTKCRQATRGDGSVAFELEPIGLDFGEGCRVEIRSTLVPGKSGRILLERRLVIPGGLTEPVKLTEYVKGCWGFTEYPEDMEGITLSTGDESINYAYRGRKIEVESPGELTCQIAKINTRISVLADAGNDLQPYQGVVAEGHLFNPYYTMELSYMVRESSILRTWIILNHIV